MIIKVLSDSAALAKAAGYHAADLMRYYLQTHKRVRLALATAASQMLFHEVLTAAKHIDWSRVEIFHLDEYIGLPEGHPASFRRYLLDRIISKTQGAKYHLLNPADNPAAAAADASEKLRSGGLHLAFIGMGENGHLALNDPPADFNTSEPYIVVPLSEASRRQQVHEGWFQSLGEVPTHALSMSIMQLMETERILCVVPGSCKAAAAQACFEQEIGPNYPGSVLRAHPDSTVFLDTASAGLLKSRTLDRYRAPGGSLNNPALT